MLVLQFVEPPARALAEGGSRPPGVQGVAGGTWMEEAHVGVAVGPWAVPFLDSGGPKHCWGLLPWVN